MPLRFAIVGITTAVIHYGVLAILVSWLYWNSTAASSLGFAMAVGFNYFMHYHWTFAAGPGVDPVPHGRALLRYAAMIAGGFVVNGALMFTATEVWGWHYLLAQALALAAVVTWNYVLASRWVYRG
jgi:dolichol-phosphate mannosyltransferase